MLKQIIRRFLKDENGATAIEYALIASLLAIALMGGFAAISGSLNTVFRFLANFFS
jgi:pilus assembly protein Flp/PilA